jgi:hypothetical protein
MRSYAALKFPFADDPSQAPHSGKRTSKALQPVANPCTQPPFTT